MYIKAVHIDGFKSYGKRVEVNGFDSMFNAITGLNGTGKSNILDSICFVLGITNLAHVRVNSLQELIFKYGQAGVNSATVSLIFDNSDKSCSPPGYETLSEITITRQVMLGSKSKYWINGCVVPNKTVQDLFCSVQLNVNNPHFLIMQGRVTKVLNMKPNEILSMLEEASGTRMYEAKKIVTVRTLEKKSAKMDEINAVIREEITPKLEKLKRERQAYNEYKNNERELVNLKNQLAAFLFYDAQRFTEDAAKKLAEAETDCQKLHDSIDSNNKAIDEITTELDELTQEANEAAGSNLQELETELKAKEKSNAKAEAIIKSTQINITREEKKLNQIEKHIKDDGGTLKKKEDELGKVENLFETLKQNDERDKEAYVVAQKKYEAICAGMEINEAGQAQSLQEQLIAMKNEASARNTEIKTCSHQLSHDEATLKKKKAATGAADNAYKSAQANCQSVRKDVQSLEASIAKLNYSEEAVTSLKQRQQQLSSELREHREKVENFTARRPQTKFTYRDPQPNFNRRLVQGVVCRLIKLKDPKYCTALETAAGGKLYNVITENEQVSKALLQHGQLQQRTTFLPLNKIQGGRISPSTVKLAQDIVGSENVMPALNLIQYDKKLQPVMEYIFGQVFICTDMDVAKKVTFHKNIMRRCVTLDGDVTDPSGTLSGGATQKSTPLLLQMADILESEAVLDANSQLAEKLETELKLKLQVQDNYEHLQQRLDVKRVELTNTEQLLQQTDHHQNMQDIEALEQNCTELKQKITEAKRIEKECLAKIKEIETNLRDADGHRERVLKQAETEMKKAKTQAEKSRKEWEKREEDYESLKLEIIELKKSIENSEKQIDETKAEIVRLGEEKERLSQEFAAANTELEKLQAKLKDAKSELASKNHEISKKNDKREKLLAQINEYKLDIQKREHTIDKYRAECQKFKNRQAECEKATAKLDKEVMRSAAKMDQKAGQALQARLARAEEVRTKLGRNINVNAQKMYEHEEKQYTTLEKRKRIIEGDKKKLSEMIADLDRKKRETLTLAYNQVKKDFGSIFMTLLPGANATLAPPAKKTIMEGLEIKVCLGGIWKENLTELSGGQRSLAALSLILSMLLFKPAPLYILDEVDAALDLSHTQNIGTMLKNHFKQSQFIVVSLKDGMFSNANVLFRTKFIDGVSAVSRTVNKN